MRDIGLADPGMHAQALHHLQGDQRGAGHHRLTRLHRLDVDQTGCRAEDAGVGQFPFSQLLARHRLLVGGGGCIHR